MDYGSGKTVCLDLLGLKGLGREPNIWPHLGRIICISTSFRSASSMAHRASRDQQIEILKKRCGIFLEHVRDINEKFNNNRTIPASNLPPHKILSELRGSLAFVDHDSDISLADLSAFTITGSLHDFNYLICRITFPMMCSLNSCPQLNIFRARSRQTIH